MQHLNGIVDDLDPKELVYLEGKGPDRVRLSGGDWNLPSLVKKPNSSMP